MKRTFAATLAATALAVVVASTSATAQYRYHHHRGGFGPGLALGLLGGAVIAGAIVASQPRGYVVYEGYGQPVYGPGCYWASQPIYDRWGRVIGYTGQPVQVCPGY